MQLPAALPVTVLPLRLQIVGVLLLSVKAKPELAVAVQVLVPPMVTGVGVQDKVMVWSSLLKMMSVVTGGAGLYVASPD